MHEYLGRLVQIINLSRNRSLNDMMYEGLGKAIIQGVIPVGERLNEKALSDHMDISRMPIRSAIKKPIEEDLVEYILKYGAVVKRMTIEGAEETYQTRIAFRTMMIIAVMERMTPENRREMQELLHNMAEKNEVGEVQQVIRYYIDFDALICRFSRMQRLEAVADKMLEYVPHFHDIFLYDARRRSPVVKEYGLIYRGMQTKDKKPIMLIVKERLNHSKESVIREIIHLRENMRDDLKDLYRRME